MATTWSCSRAPRDRTGRRGLGCRRRLLLRQPRGQPGRDEEGPAPGSAARHVLLVREILGRNVLRRVRRAQERTTELARVVDLLLGQPSAADLTRPAEVFVQCVFLEMAHRLVTTPGAVTQNAAAKR